MAPTLVVAAVAGLLAAALLGPAFDRRSVAIVVGAAIVPDVDAAISLAIHGTTNAALHTLFLPAAAAAAIYWDTERRDRSWLRRRWGWWGIRTAWVAVSAYAVAGIGLDLCSPAGANLLWPLHDRFYAVSGRLLYSTQDGLIQSYVAIGDDGLLSIGSVGTTETHHVATWINPTPDTGIDTGVERRATIVGAGWHVILILTAAAVLAIRFRRDRDGPTVATSGSSPADDPQSPADETETVADEPEPGADDRAEVTD